jgi:hypothetical protein
MQWITISLTASCDQGLQNLLEMANLTPRPTHLQNNT